MKYRVSSAAAYLALSLCCIGCAGDDGEDDLETRTERLRPASNSCVTSDTCPYGHCTTEDGVCDPTPGCSPAAYCTAACYGTCVATPRAASTPEGG
jgi:hypothetical protein